MILEELRSIVAAGESEQVEFKHTTGQRSEAVRTVYAMLNGIGGFVLFPAATPPRARSPACP